MALLVRPPAREAGVKGLEKKMDWQSLLSGFVLIASAFGCLMQGLIDSGHVDT